ncbi:MAG: hypothetical protein FJW63_06015 [Actinobacteria bacterium]|nr:hypothetical protein [Actinomycetota bacterium]
MIEEKKSPKFGILGVFSIVPLRFKNSFKGEIAIRDKDGKEISLDRLWEKYIPICPDPGRWVNLNIELLDYDEEKDINLIKEIVDKKKNDEDDINENTEEDATEDVKIITKTGRGTLFIRPYSFIDRIGLGEKFIIGYNKPYDYGDLFGERSLSLSQILEKFIGREVILTLRMEASDEDEDEDDFEDENNL